jgi:hypothetical protein
VGGCTSKSESSSLTIFRFGIVVQNYALAIHNQLTSPARDPTIEEKGMIRVRAPDYKQKQKKTRVEIFGGKQNFHFLDLPLCWVLAPPVATGALVRCDRFEINNKTQKLFVKR